eukprot:393757_1
MSIKCKYCWLKVSKNASALKSHLQTYHSSIKVERRPDGQGSVHVYRPQKHDRHSLSVLLYNFKYNSKAWIFFDTLLTLATEAHFVQIRITELVKIRNTTQHIYEYITSYNAYSVLTKYKCSRQIAILVDDYMNGIGISLRAYCKYIIKFVIKQRRSFYKSLKKKKLPLHRHQRNQKRWTQGGKDKPVTHGSFGKYVSPDSEDDIEITSSSGNSNSGLVLQSDGGFKLKLSTKLNFAGGDRKVAMFRLCRDLTECVKHPLPMISAQPVSDSNLFEWHACMVGPPQSNYEDIAFHFVIKISEYYPLNPPSITLCSYFEHPNVFGKKICLDILEGYIGNTSKYIGGWSSAYSIQ